VAETGPLRSGRPRLADVVGRGHMPALDGFRAIAALSVVCYHFGYDVKFDGVTGFFVLSGFLITTLLMRERDTTGTVSLKNFYARRTLRIFPAYYAFVVASFALDNLRNTIWPRGLTLAAFFYGINYYNAFLGHPPTSVAHAWSLAVEEQFYLLWPLLFLALYGRSVATVRRVLVGVIVASIGWRLLAHLALGVDKAYLYNAFDARFDNLAIGCLLAIAIRDERCERVAAMLTARTWYPVVTLAALFATVAFVPSPERYYFAFTLYSALIAVLLVQWLLLSGRPLWSWLDHPVTRYLGTISYPIYLWHGWAVGAAHKLTMLPRPAQFVVALGVTVAVASGSYWIIERPALRLKRYFTGPRPDVAPAMSVSEAKVS
jgi:peptidoglycan/LPS O-acetylase OafA/YrhL